MRPNISVNADARERLIQNSIRTARAGYWER